jgi:hypothetical protein
MTNEVLEAVGTVNSVAPPATVRELLERYERHLQTTPDPSKAQQEIRLTQTALLRYTVPGWGGPKPLSERLSSREIEAAIKFTESIGLAQFQKSLAVLEKVIQQLENTEPREDRKKYFQELRKRNRHYFLKLWNWTNDQGWFEPFVIQKPTTAQYCFSKKVEGKDPLSRVRLTERRYTERSSQKSSELDCEQKLQEKTFALGTVKGDFINLYLQTQLTDLRNSMTDGRMGESLREVSADQHLNNVLQLLGWFHRVEGVPLADLRLETLVPFVELRPSIEDTDSTDQLVLKSWLAEEKAKRVAGEIEENARKHLHWRDSRIPGNPKLSPSSKLSIIGACIVVAKYVYRSQTNQDDTDNFGDIPAVRRLRKLSRELTKQRKNTPNVVPHDAKMVPWTELLKAVEQYLRVEADLERYSDGSKRSQRARGGSMQRFLLSSFMTIMPPDRQRTYRELVEGKTLVQGQLNGSGFTPRNRMADPENAKWYIQLEPSDYKTGSTYGPWLGEVPNVHYPDGKTFYGYIDEWRHHWRQVFAPNHQYFFTQPNGKPFTAISLKDLIRKAFYRLLGVPITPHIFRSMFITYLYEQQVSGHVLDSAALAMHHSRRMQAESYNRQEQSDKLLPSLTLAVDLVHQVVGSSSVIP